jgi:RHS repeat-associated protein
VSACTGGTSQNWAVGSDGTVRLLGKCLDVKAAGTANGTLVDLSSCTGSTGQQWRAGANGSLTNPQSGRCLEDPSDSRTPGTQLDIRDCGTAAGQHWTTANAGNQPTDGSTQALAWNDQGKLSSVTASVNGTTTATTSYVYNADGDQLIRRDPTQTTLFVGDTEIVVNTAVTPHVLLGGVRNYTAGGGTLAIATRSTLPGGGVAYVINDSHGTAVMDMDVNTQAVSRSEHTPFGSVRATTGTTWADPTHGFLGSPLDTSTGYTDVGARKYDPTLGRFISGDPVLSANMPAEMNGYGYAAENPVSRSDPSGNSSWWEPIANPLASAFVHTVDFTGHLVGNAMKPLDPAVRFIAPHVGLGTPNDPSAFLMGWQWATGTGPKNRTLTGDNQFTKTLQQHYEVENARKDIAEKVLSGALKVGDPGHWNHSLGGSFINSITKLAKDFTSNSAAAFLGSYKLDYKVTGINLKAGTVTVAFHVANDSTIASATHLPPPIGYGNPWADKHIAGPENADFASGIMSKASQSVLWTETFSLNDPKAPTSDGGGSNGDGSPDGGSGGGGGGGGSTPPPNPWANKLAAMERMGF